MREEVRPDQAGHEAAHLGPWIERAHREVGQRKGTGGDQQERPLRNGSRTSVVEPPRVMANRLPPVIRDEVDG
jgi:hypothetical protein